MSEWRLLYGPLDDSGAMLGELPVTSMQFAESLNGAGRWSASLPLNANPSRLSMPISELASLKDEGPVGLWLLDEASGTVMADALGHGRDGAYVSGPSLGSAGPTPMIQRAVDFTTSLKYAEVTETLAAPYVFPDRQPFSFEVWINFPAGILGDFRRILSCEAFPTNVNGWWLATHGTQGFRFYRTVGGVFRDARWGSPIVANEWYHVAGTYDGTTIRLYVNGSAGATTATNTTAMPANFAPLMLNTDSARSTPAGARVAGLVVWDRALSQAEIQQHYAEQSALTADTAELDPALGLISRATLAPARTRVWFERDGVLMHSGIVWTAKANMGDNTLDIAGEGVHSYFRRRHIRTNLTFTGVEQHEIARQLVTLAQTDANSSIGVQLDPSNSRVGRDRSWLSVERKSIGEAIEQLGNVENGFDWAYRTAWVAGVPTTTFTFSGPMGRRTEHVFDVGTNCSLLSYDEDGTTISNRVDAIGAGEGSDALIASVANASLQGPYRILEDVISHSDVRDIGTLYEHAWRRLSRGVGPIRHVELQVFADAEPPIGSYEVGDQVTVRADYGWVRLDGAFRIVEVAVGVSGGIETVALALAGLEVFEIV